MADDRPRAATRIRLELPASECVIMSVRKVRASHFRRMRLIAAERDATLEAVLDAALEAGLGTLEAAVRASEKPQEKPAPEEESGGDK